MDLVVFTRETGEDERNRITPGSHSGAAKTVVRVVPIIIGALGSITKTLKTN